MEEVVPIRTDLDVKMWQAERDEGKLDEAAERLALTGPIRRLRQALAGAPAASE
jgi:hypothetical protein